MRKILLLSLVALVSSTLSFAQTGLGSTVDNLVIKTHDGQDFDLYKQFKEGRAVLLDLWWVECGNCVVWAPAVEQLYLDYGKNTQELFVLGLNITKSTDPKAATNDNAGIAKFKSDKGLTYPDAGFEGNMDGGSSKVRSFWSRSVYPIYNHGSFAQCILLMPNVTDAAKSSVIWLDFGNINSSTKTSVADIKAAMVTNKIKEKYTATQVSVQDPEAIKNAIYVFPNPATDQINVHLDNAENSFSVEIRDLAGKLVFSNNYNSIQDVTISTSELASGYYSLSIISEQGISTRKIVID